MTARLVVLAVLTALPLLVYAAGGGWLVVREGWGWPLAGLATGCWALLAVVAKVWTPAAEAASAVEAKDHWSPQDEGAAEILDAFQRETIAAGVDLADPDFYVDSAVELSRRMAEHYRPGDADAVASLTLTELLAAVRLAVEDLEDWAVRHLPARHLLTVRNLRRLHKAGGQLKNADAAWWLTSIALQPAQSLRWALSKGTLDPGREALREELAQAVALKYTQLLGEYFIELNSGRLAAGAAAYREAFDARLTAARRRGLSPPTVTIALVGQVSSGKSSLVNALVGDAVAATGPLPQTRAVERFEARLGETPVELLDTPGYGEDGLTAAQLADVSRTLRRCDVAVLVMAANSPAKRADAETLNALAQHFAGQTSLRPPPVVAAVTKIDLLAPPTHWSPPYDVEHPDGPKAENIASAVAYAEELFAGGRLAVASATPVRADADHVWNVQEGLVPALAAVLDDAQTVALLRGYEQTLSRDRWAAMAKQAGRLVGSVAGVWLEQKVRAAKSEADRPGPSSELTASPRPSEPPRPPS